MFVGQSSADTFMFPPATPRVTQTQSKNKTMATLTNEYAQFQYNQLLFHWHLHLCG